ALAGAHSAYRAMQEDARRHFVDEVAVPVHDLQARLQAYGDLLFAVRGLFQFSGDVSRDQFRRFVQSLAIGDRYPGITGVTYAARGTEAEREAYERAMLAGAFPGAGNFPIRPAGPRDEYVVLQYIEHLAPHASPWGLDLLGDAERAEGVQKARDS